MSGSGLRRGMEEAVELDLRAILLTSSIICTLVRRMERVVTIARLAHLLRPLFEVLRSHNNRGISGLEKQVGAGPVNRQIANFIDDQEKWPHPFEQQPEVFKWSLCCYLRCQFTRRQHHGKGLIRCVPVQARMGSRSVVPIQVLPIDCLASVTESYAGRYARSYFTDCHRRSTNTLSLQVPRPSMLRS